MMLLVDPPGEAAWNMAVDEALVASAAEGQATLRFYGWSEPSLSLGYFQPLAAREEHAASRRCPLVRRASGGGAILHDRELTYSIALPHAHPLARRPEELYRAAHQSLIAALAPLAELPLVRNPAADPLSPEPFLCFQRRAAGDVLCGQHKIAGSAQRRTRGGVLQHGSVLLNRSTFAPELPGWCDLSGQNLSPEELAARWLPHLSKALSAQPVPSDLTPQERQLAAELAKSRFGNPTWTSRR